MVSDTQARHEGSGNASELHLQAILSTRVVPLLGRTLTGLRGPEGAILEVDGRGITRVCSNGSTSRIAREPIRWKIERILEGRQVPRPEIHFGADQHVMSTR